MTLPRVQVGKRVEHNAADENKRRDFINTMMKISGMDQGGFGSTGESVVQGFAAPHAIFELQWSTNGGTSYVVWDPDDANAPIPPGLDSVPDVPYSLNARRIWVDHAANTYGQANLSRDTTLYFPLATDVDDVGGYSDGERAPAWYDVQSGRWWSLNKSGGLSSSSGSSGSSGSSSGSSGEESSSSGSSSGEESSSSSGESCSYSGTFSVGTGDLTRVGDYIEETRLELEFLNGLLCSVNPDGKASVYLCCEDSSSSSGSGSGSSGP